MGWEKIGLLDALERNNTFFSDDYGCVRISLRKLEVKVDDNYVYVSDLYIKEGDYLYPFSISASNIKDIQKTKFYMKNKDVNSRCYDKHIPLKSGTLIKIKAYKITVEFRDGLDDHYYSYRNTTEELFEVNKLDELNEIIFYRTYDFKCDQLLPINFLQLKVGNKVFCKKYNTGLCTINKIYDYPNKDNFVCSVITPDKKKVDITWNDYDLYYPPYQNVTSEYDFLNESINELCLQPFADFGENTINVYWRKIEDASNYIVSIYRITDEKYLDKIIHMKDYDVDRNDGFLSIQGIENHNRYNKYAIVVKAENRNGEVIAKCRGIDKEGKPKNWDKL